MTTADYKDLSPAAQKAGFRILTTGRLPVSVDEALNLLSRIVGTDEDREALARILEVHEEALIEWANWYINRITRHFPSEMVH